MKKVLCLLCVLVLLMTAAGCTPSKNQPTLGVSFGVGPAARWPLEQGYMEAKAKELGAQMTVRFNTSEEEKPQKEDCFELIDSGIDVLILIPRDVNNTADILAYAKEKGVKVISYSRIIMNEKFDLFVGYDSSRIGQMMGEYLAEMVYEGDYIILRGDSGDSNATLLYEGALQRITPLGDNINILLDEPVPGWDPDTAKQMVKKAISKNGNKVDAILAPNDKIAGACIEVLEELGVTAPVSVTGMDAELDALKRVAAGTQSMTVYMELKPLAETAVIQAYNMALGNKADINAEFDNQSGEGGVPANLITGQLIVKENLDKNLIDTGLFTREEIYGK